MAGVCRGQSRGTRTFFSRQWGTCSVSEQGGDQICRSGRLMWMEKGTAAQGMSRTGA